MTHHAFVTGEVPEVRDQRKVSSEIRMEQKKGLIGIYEKANPNTVRDGHCPWETENKLSDADCCSIMPWLEESRNRIRKAEGWANRARA
jgi:dimethylglycine dehydrogenase